MRAKTILLITAVAIGVLSLPGSAAAQFGVNSKYFGIHLGVSDIGSAAAIGLNGEVAYNDRVGIGAWADTWSYGQRLNFGGSNYDWNVRYVALAATGAYHFPVRTNRKLDPFAGAGLGYYVVTTSGNDFGGATYTGSTSRMFLSLFGGARYALSPSASGVLRIGFGSAWVTLGVDFKM